MTRPLDRDDEMDAVLRQALRRPGGGRAEDCPDADLLAAFADGRLRPVERAPIETHAADCDRCQAVLAALVRTAHLGVGAPSRPARGLRDLLSPVWLVPATAVAAAAAIWIAVSPRPAPVEVDAAPQLATRQDPSDRFSSPPAVPPILNEEVATAPVPIAPRPNRRPASPSAAREVAPVPSLPDAAPLAKPDATAQQNAATAASAAAPEAMRFEAPATAKSAAALERRVQAVPAPGATNPSALMDVDERIAGQRVLTPDPDKLWMLGPRGSMLRSIDGGASFQAQPTSTTARLTAAAAPAPDVCWVVGDDGTVLLTTDGRTWRRTAFPERTALLSVSATSGLDAVVTAADGRRWSTADGGRTWVLQGR